MFDKMSFEPLGVRSAPFGFPRKHIAPAIAAALVQTAGSALSNVFGNVSNVNAQRSANATNLQIARETNEMSQAQFDRNMDWMREQYYGNQEYNSAAAQVERLRAAGLNPALAMSGGNMSGVSSSVGAPSPSQFATAHSEPGLVDYTQFGSAVGNAVNAYFQNQLLSKQVESQDINNDNARFAMQFRLEKLLAELQEVQSRAEEQRQRAGLHSKERDDLDSQIAFRRQQIRIIMSQAEDLMRQPEKQNALLDVQHDNMLADTALKRAQALAVESGIHLTAAQTEQILASIQQAWQQLSINRDFQQADAAYKRNAVIHMLSEDSATFESLGLSKELLTSQKFSNYVGSVLGGFGAAMLGRMLPFGKFTKFSSPRRIGFTP